MGMCIDMCEDKCIDMCMHISMDTCKGMCIDMCASMSMDVRRDDLELPNVEVVTTVTTMSWAADSGFHANHFVWTQLLHFEKL